MEDKISRICWNSQGLRFPSGSQGKSRASKSCEAANGFGHEEWLFDKSRIINGYHYTFLQQLNLKSDKHVGKTYNILTYTITNNIKYYTGKINNTICISKNESKDIYKIYGQNGWLREMASEIKKAGANSKPFTKTPPRHFFNVKFKFKDVIKPEGFEEISTKDINITTTRYKLLPKKNEIKIAIDISKDDNEGKLKNTQKRKRKYKADSSIDPYHDKLQNALCQLLRKSYKNKYKKIIIETDRVDIKAMTNTGKWHYFEIKTDSPKLSIRNGLGQILEYSCWPDVMRAEKLIIVSDKEPDSETQKYLAHIRNKFDLPVYYRLFDMEMNNLSADY